MVYVSGVNPYPNCLLCGLGVSRTSYSPNVNPTPCDILLRRSKWKHHKKGELGHVMVPSKEVEEVDFAKFPSMWSCFCRARPNTKYFLSGTTVIGVQTEHPYFIPKDRSIVRIGGRKRNLQYDDGTFAQFYAASIKRQPSCFKGKNVGFVVHAHCWALFDHIISTTLVEKKFEKFVRAARKYCRDHKAWGSYDYLLTSWKIGPRGAHPGFMYGCYIALVMRKESQFRYTGL